MSCHKRDIVLVHGFNVRDRGAHTTDRLIPHIDHLGQVRQADYGWLGLFSVRWMNPFIARTIAGMVDAPAVGIGHSNGCAILHRASHESDKLEHIILINPALDEDAEFGPSVKRVDVLHNPTDEPVQISKWLPFRHPWGAMGRYGYVGDDNRVINHNTYRLFGARGHGGAFDNQHVARVGQYVAHILYSFEFGAGAN